MISYLFLASSPLFWITKPLAMYHFMVSQWMVEKLESLWTHMLSE